MKSEYLKTCDELMKGNTMDSYSNYGGDTDHKYDYVVLTRTRDSKCIELSNFDVALKALKDSDSNNTYTLSFNHWAFGWIEHIFVKPNSIAQKEAEDIICALADYPVLDDDDYCEKEAKEAYEVWCNCYNKKDRIEYIRKNRYQFEFSNFSDLMGCVRGEFFCGYASELIG